METTKRYPKYIQRLIDQSVRDEEIYHAFCAIKQDYPKMEKNEVYKRLADQQLFRDRNGKPLSWTGIRLAYYRVKEMFENVPAS